jgi:YTH domain-containing protein 1
MQDLWTTQRNNEEMFQSSFKNFRNVIFLFSVNNSKAFQGYALMESEPGSEPLPEWSKSLHWPCAGAFRIKWFTIHTTPFFYVHHLRNPKNPDLDENGDFPKVMVGRDGQEVEEDVGWQVCEIIDQECAKNDSWKGDGGKKRKYAPSERSETL